jgi:hypothetical protein
LVTTDADVKQHIAAIWTTDHVKRLDVSVDDSILNPQVFNRSGEVSDRAHDSASVHRPDDSRDRVPLNELFGEEHIGVSANVNLPNRLIKDLSEVRVDSSVANCHLALCPNAIHRRHQLENCATTGDIDFENLPLTALM